MKLSLIVLAVVMSCAVVQPSFSSSDNCEYSRELTREVNLDESRKLKVVAGAGTLGIKGVKSRDSVLVKAALCAQSESRLAEMDVSYELNDGSMRLKTEFPKSAFFAFGRSRPSYINLEVYVPANAVLDVVDSSGAASVEGVESLVMEDSSGSLLIQDVAGDVRVKDSSGALRIGSVAGNVWVRDSSGVIKVVNIAGNFTVDVDSSGAIEASDVQGNVLVRADSSGSINVRDVGGDFTVGRDSSGGINHRNVAGAVSLPK